MSDKQENNEKQNNNQQIPEKKQDGQPDNKQSENPVQNHAGDKHNTGEHSSHPEGGDNKEKTPSNNKNG